jgi:ABC-2 type transport system permease protein
VMTLVGILIVFFGGLVTVVVPNVSQQLRDLATYFSSAVHMQDFSRGLIDTRAIVFYLSMTALLQFLTFQVFQYRKWKF